MAKFLPWVTFYVLGKAHDEIRNLQLKQISEEINNVKFLGFEDGKTKSEVLSKAWILVNCSLYECLPVSFLEALSYKCAILSTVDPDGYTSKFGRFTTESDLVKNLSWILDFDRWRMLGEEGYKYVKSKHSTEVGVNNHLRIYEGLIKK